MGKNIILAGVGGQGILTLAAIIDHAAMGQGLNIKQAEVHGMSQRGGAVQSHLRISETKIYSDLIPMGKADIILSLESMEVLRYLPYLTEKAMVITATTQINNIPDYPDEEHIRRVIEKTSQRYLFVDPKNMAKQAGNVKTENVVMVGVVSKFIDIEKEQFENSIQAMFEGKGRDIVETNLKAFNLGYAFALQAKFMDNL